MRYTEINGQKFVENGHSKVRVELVTFKPSPVQSGRTLKVFEVVEVIKTHDDNPIIVGHNIALSFPNEKVHTREYIWYKDGWEECSVPLKISDRAVMRSLAGGR